MGSNQSQQTFEAFGNTRHLAIDALELLLLANFNCVIYTDGQGYLYVRDAHHSKHYIDIDRIEKGGRTFYRAYVQV